jgi:chromosome segregation ATPase
VVSLKVLEKPISNPALKQKPKPKMNNQENTCQYCGKKYKKSGHIKNHIETVHRDVVKLLEEERAKRVQEWKEEEERIRNSMISSFNEKEDFLHNMILELKKTIDELQDDVKDLRQTLQMSNDPLDHPYFGS